MSNQAFLSTLKKMSEKSNDTGQNWIEDAYNHFPLILTTADSFLYNFKDFLKKGKKVDCIIIDEATQCDVLTGLPLLYMAKELKVVGDSKQLTAITDKLEEEYININRYHVQEENNFLEAIKNSFQITGDLLEEHYRCDYNIINFCNKYYYDNKLKIYTDNHQDSMNIMNVNTQKACKEDQFLNEREIISLKELAKENKNDSFFITPFKAQGELLKKTFGDKCAGTIHTFQGKGSKIVYFNTVLNDLKICVNHLKGQHSLFYKELINVAVSRAKQKCFVVGDIDFFKKYEENCVEMKHLIDYIEIYGKELKDKTVCLFDNLYKQIPFYNKNDNYDNAYEEALHKKIIDILKDNPGFHCYLKMFLVNLVLDKPFLNSHPNIKNYVYNRSHVDFLIVDERIHKPVLAIELDGKYHLRKEQQEKDRMKKRLYTT